jgi:hypothetical protein
VALSRRSALGLGIGGGILLALGSASVVLEPTALVAPARPLRVLTPEQYAILHAVAERCHPGKGKIPSASDIGVAGLVDELLASADPGYAGDFGRALLFFESPWTRFFFEGRFLAFSRATPEQQDHILENWRDARSHLRRQIFHAMLGLCSAAYWGDPRTWAVIEYPGPPIPPRRE